MCGILYNFCTEQAQAQAQAHTHTHLRLGAGELGIALSCFCIILESTKIRVDGCSFVFNVFEEGALPLREKALHDAGLRQWTRDVVLDPGRQPASFPIDSGQRLKK
jgi:hypothetical protein